MNRRHFLAATVGLSIAGARPAVGAGAPGTRWRVRPSQGYDALSFLSPLSGDAFYLRYYEEAVAAFLPRLPEGTAGRIGEMKQRIAETGGLLSPYLDLIFSSGHDRDIPALLAAIADRDRLLLPAYRESVYWNEEGWRAFEEICIPLAAILDDMREAGFAQFWRERSAERLTERVARLEPKLAAFDVIPELERYTGRAFDPEIQVVLLEFCKPHGIKVQGQQFLTAIDWNDDIVIRTAGHELLHPPVDANGDAFNAALDILRQDALLTRIVAEHDPAFGYNTLAGLIDEDLASALDQIIGERLGVARDPAERWNSVDDGMHVLAAGLYALMRRSGFADHGGDLEHWLSRMAYLGWLAPPSLHGAAAGVLGRPADRLWPLGG